MIMLMISDIFKGNKADLDYLIKLGKELKTQDGLATRKPLIFKIQDIEVVECVEDNEDFKKIQFNFGDVDTMAFDETEIEQTKIFIKSNFEHIFCDDNDETLTILNECNDLEDIRYFCFDNDIESEIIYYARKLRFTGEFLTRNAAKEYLKKYRYRFNEPKIYIAYGGENKELVKLTEVLERLYEMNCKEDLNAQ